MHCFPTFLHFGVAFPFSMVSVSLHWEEWFLLVAWHSMEYERSLQGFLDEKWHWMDVQRKRGFGFHYTTFWTSEKRKFGR